METAQILLGNIDRLHTTAMGIERIRKNLLCKLSLKGYSVSFA